MFVILNPSLRHSERSEEPSFFAQYKLCEESNRINELEMEILRLLPQNDIMTQTLKGEEIFIIILCAAAPLRESLS